MTKDEFVQQWMIHNSFHYTRIDANNLGNDQCDALYNHAINLANHLESEGVKFKPTQYTMTVASDDCKADT